MSLVPPFHFGFLILTLPSWSDSTIVTTNGPYLGDVFNVYCMDFIFIISYITSVNYLFYWGAIILRWFESCPYCWDAYVGVFLMWAVSPASLFAPGGKRRLVENLGFSSPSLAYVVVYFPSRTLPKRWLKGGYPHFQEGMLASIFCSCVVTDYWIVLIYYCMCSSPYVRLSLIITVLLQDPWVTCSWDQGAWVVEDGWPWARSSKSL